MCGNETIFVKVKDEQTQGSETRRDLYEFIEKELE